MLTFPPAYYRTKQIVMLIVGSYGNFCQGYKVKSYGRKGARQQQPAHFGLLQLNQIPYLCSIIK